MVQVVVAAAKLLHRLSMTLYAFVEDEPGDYIGVLGLAETYSSMSTERALDLQGAARTVGASWFLSGVRLFCWVGLPEFGALTKRKLFRRHSSSQRQEMFRSGGEGKSWKSILQAPWANDENEVIERPEKIFAVVLTSIDPLALLPIEVIVQHQLIRSYLLFPEIVLHREVLESLDPPWTKFYNHELSLADGGRWNFELGQIPHQHFR
mmetsp:Transcript_10518/g.25683  ORF Transcript_10518/g.25683 Transcript_10518/m.25683 type:complete len:208 (+) Transcript_10518:339-962(+)